MTGEAAGHRHGSRSGRPGGRSPRRRGLALIAFAAVIGAGVSALAVTAPTDLRRIDGSRPDAVPPAPHLAATARIAAFLHAVNRRDLLTLGAQLRAEPRLLLIRDAAGLTALDHALAADDRGLVEQLARSVPYGLLAARRQLAGPFGPSLRWFRFRRPANRPGSPTGTVSETSARLRPNTGPDPDVAHQAGRPCAASHPTSLQVCDASAARPAVAAIRSHFSPLASDFAVTWPAPMDARPDHASGRSDPRHRLKPPPTSPHWEALPVRLLTVPRFRVTTRRAPTPGAAVETSLPPGAPALPNSLEPDRHEVGSAPLPAWTAAGAACRGAPGWRAGPGEAARNASLAQCNGAVTHDGQLCPVAATMAARNARFAQRNGAVRSAPTHQASRLLRQRSRWPVLSPWASPTPTPRP